MGVSSVDPPLRPMIVLTAERHPHSKKRIMTSTPHEFFAYSRGHPHSKKRNLRKKKFCCSKAWLQVEEQQQRGRVSIPKR